MESKTTLNALECLNWNEFNWKCEIITLQTRYFPGYGYLEFFAALKFVFVVNALTFPF